MLYVLVFDSQGCVLLNNSYKAKVLYGEYSAQLH